jgi:hypothetical protein
MLAGSKSKKGESDRDSGARSPSRQSSLSGSGCVNSPNRNEKSSELPTPASIAVHTPIIVASKPDRATKVVNRDEGPNGKAFYPLKKIKQAKRYGLKVINMNESILIVGEVSLQLYIIFSHEKVCQIINANIGIRRKRLWLLVLGG